MQELKELLQQGVAIVSFVKLDGTERVMPCTLNPTLIPEEHMPKNFSEEPVEDDYTGAQPVYEMKNESWRSFRWDRVTSWREGSVSDWIKS